MFRCGSCIGMGCSCCLSSVRCFLMCCWCVGSFMGCCCSSVHLFLYFWVMRLCRSRCCRVCISCCLMSWFCGDYWQADSQHEHQQPHQGKIHKLIVIIKSELELSWGQVFAVDGVPAFWERRWYKPSHRRFVFLFKRLRAWFVVECCNLSSIRNDLFVSQFHIFDDLKSTGDVAVYNILLSLLISDWLRLSSLFLSLIYRWILSLISLERFRLSSSWRASRERLRGSSAYRRNAYLETSRCRPYREGSRLS
jgi:hypothetical protein